MALNCFFIKIKFNAIKMKKYSSKSNAPINFADESVFYIPLAYNSKTF